MGRREGVNDERTKAGRGKRKFEQGSLGWGLVSRKYVDVDAREIELIPVPVIG